VGRRSVRVRITVAALAVVGTALIVAAVALVARVGYEAVVESEVPGFVENRILYAIMREAVDLVDRGIIDADGMDRCVRWGIGYKLALPPPRHEKLAEYRVLVIDKHPLCPTEASITTRKNAA